MTFTNPPQEIQNFPKFYFEDVFSVTYPNVFLERIFSAYIYIKDRQNRPVSCHIPLKKKVETIVWN